MVRSTRRRGRGVWLLAALVAAFVGLQATDVGRGLTVRSYVRAERLWSREMPAFLAGWPRRVVEPVLSRVGLIGPVRVEVEPGVSLLLDPFDDVSRTILISRDGRWEPEVWAAIESGLTPGAVFVDVGAYIGYDSLKAAKTVGPAGMVVAFEPNPTTLEMLRANLAASGVTNVVVQPIALADEEGELTLFDSSATGNSGSSSLSAANAGGDGRPYRVSARPLDSVVEELQLTRVDVVKADVEGAEVLVLKGAQQTLRRFRPKLVLEIVPGQLEAMGTSVDELEQLLHAAGYGQGRWVDYKNKEYQFDNEK